MLTRLKKQSGQSVLELMIAMFIFVLVVSGIMFLVLDAQTANRQGGERTKAAFLTQEAYEAAQSIANQGWKNLVDGDYGLDNTSGYWQWQGATDVFDDKYVRQVSVESVFRDGNGDIVESGGTLDFDTKKVITRSAWDFTTTRPSEVLLETYFTNWHSYKWLQTTQADFNAGTINQVAVTNNEGGELELATLGVEDNNNWPFDVPANYVYNPAEIGITGSSAQLASVGLDGFGGTLNPGIDGSLVPWVYQDWDQNGGEVNVAGTRRGSGGNPGGRIRIRFPRRSQNDQVGGFVEQPFNVTETDSTNAYISFDWRVSQYSLPNEPTNLEVYAFLDTSTGEPLHRTEIWSSGNLTSTTSYSNESVDITSLVSLPGTYYLKLAVWMTSGGTRTSAVIDISFDNASAYWEKASDSYISTGPSIEPAVAFTPASILSWSGLIETSVKPPALAVNWWDANYIYRQPISVDTGANYPFSGYNGYTVRVTGLDTSSLISANKMLSNCNDLRIARDDGVSWSEFDRQVINCNTANTEVRWRLQSDIAVSSSDASYYLYYGYNSASTPPNNLNNIYQWYDDATSNNLASYILGRGDAWHGTGYQACTYNIGGQYYDGCGDADNVTSSMRQAVSERDVYIEAEIYYDCAWPSNMTTGLVARYEVLGGSGASEEADHYYASNRAELDTSQNCGGGISASGYSHDGDILKTSRTITAIDGTDQSDAANDQWTKQGLAVWGTNPTNLTYWNSDTLASFGTAGWPTITPLASGTDATDYENPGDAGIMVAQNRLRIRNILIRRYIEPEPTISLFAEEQYTPGGSGEIYYQLSDDDGATWKYWTGSDWQTAGVTDYNTDDEVDSNIASFPVTASGIKFKAFLVSDGTQQVRLDNVRIEYLMPGGTDYAPAGDFISAARDTGINTTVYNYIEWAATLPVSSAVVWQLKIADSQANLSSAIWTGPDGTSGSFYNTQGQIIVTDPGATGARWLQYKAYLSSDGTVTPIVKDITIDYED